jgi:hypothetical protein
MQQASCWFVREPRTLPDVDSFSRKDVQRTCQAPGPAIPAADAPAGRRLLEIFLSFGV